MTASLDSHHLPETYRARMPRTSLGSMRVAVMQPYFFPYLGYLQMLRAVDVVVILDDAQFVPRRWINRNRIIASGEVRWLTFPVKRAPQKTAIRDVAYDLESRDTARMLRGFNLEFGRLPGYGPTKALLLAALGGEESAAENNIESLQMTLEMLGHPIRGWCRSSELGAEGLTGSERIIALAHSVGATHYVNLPGGQTLYDHHTFRSAGMELEFIVPTFPEYRQPNEAFIPGLSILDVIARAGLDTASGMLSSDCYSLRRADS